MSEVQKLLAGKVVVNYLKREVLYEGTDGVMYKAIGRKVTLCILLWGVSPFFFWINRFHEFWGFVQFMMWLG